MSYSPEMVAQLLPAVWDSTITHIDSPTCPDSDMPRQRPDPKLGGTMLALLADIRWAWRKAPLSHEDRVALFLTYGLDWSQQEVGDLDRSCRQTVAGRNSRGLGILLFTLNGKEWEDTDDSSNDDGEE